MLEKMKKTEMLSEELKVVGRVLSSLRALSTPVTLKELSEGSQLTQGQVSYAIKVLQDRGYDVKSIRGKETKYSLVRFGQNDMQLYYRTLGKIETPCILTTDWHVGSHGFSDIILKRMIDDIKRLHIKDVIHAGDFYQGRGVHRMELEDCKSISIDDQENDGLAVLNKFPNWTEFHAVIGNHEEKIKGSVQVGHDMLLTTANMKDLIPTFNYYGHVAKLSLNKKHTLLLIHTSGGVTYAKSYKAERVFDQLTERPNLLVTGHQHQLFAVGRPPNVVVVQAGTLQRENSFLLNMGVTAQVGYIILHNFDSESANFEFVRPRVF